MHNKPMLYANAQIRQLEQIAISQYALSEQTLMQRAGVAAFNTLKALWPHAASVSIFCGGGNNGGDGYVVAYLAKQAGFAVQLFYFMPVEKLQGAARAAAQACVDAGMVLEVWHEAACVTGDVLVDALFGTGLTRRVAGIWYHAIKSINAQTQPVLAIDVPSGLDSDNGSIHGISVTAKATITFIGEKIGLYTGQAADHTGTIILDTLGIPEAAYSAIVPHGEKLICQVSDYLPRRSRCAHKGDFGHVLVIGGNDGMPGSVRMAAQAALRVGAGRVTVATRAYNVHAVVAGQAEIMCFAVSTAADIKSLLEKATVVLLGPGLGLDEWAQTLFAATLQCPLPMIIDADGLNILAQYPAYSQQWLLTPHPGEAARLLGCDTATIQADRINALKRIQKKFGGVCLLKGAGSLVRNDQDNLGVCPVASPAMATAGMGDVLSGVLASLVAQGVSLLNAAKLGMCLHARAALQAAIVGERGVLATDLLPYLHLLVNENQDVNTPI
jgi:ADP-dependent NAD(P)H-hydrate dehydratase / NAD(P)H-hydrate epimerase